MTKLNKCQPLKNLLSQKYTIITNLVYIKVLNILGKQLGEGTFSKVYLCHHRITNEPVAIKVLEKSGIKNDEDYERIKREIHILKQVRHPNIIQLYEVTNMSFNLFSFMNLKIAYIL